MQNSHGARVSFTSGPMTIWAFSIHAMVSTVGLMFLICQKRIDGQ